MSLKVNEKATDFTLVDDQGKSFRLSEQTEKRLLLVFYPGDNTPVCTRQLCDYRDGIEVFADLGVEVVGISSDDIESHQQFRQQHGLPFRLLSDPDLEVADLYGCRGMMGMKRAVFLLDEGRVVRYAHVETLALFRRSREDLIEVIRGLDN